jgi:hypothetical protein
MSPGLRPCTAFATAWSGGRASCSTLRTASSPSTSSHVYPIRSSQLPRCRACQLTNSPTDHPSCEGPMMPTRHANRRQMLTPVWSSAGGRMVFERDRIRLGSRSA